MIGLLLAAQLTVIVQMEQHQTIEAQGDVVVTNSTSRYVYSAPVLPGQLQNAIEVSADTATQTASNSIAAWVASMLPKIDPRRVNESITVVMP